MNGAILYTTRVAGGRFQSPVYSNGTFAVRVGRERPDGPKLVGLVGKEAVASGQRGCYSVRESVEGHPLTLAGPVDPLLEWSGFHWLHH